MDVDAKDGGTQVVGTTDLARTGAQPAPLGTIPTQRSRISLTRPQDGRSRRTWAVLAGGLVLLMAGATTGLAAQRAATVREEQLAEARLRVTSVLPAATQDMRVAGALETQAVASLSAEVRTSAAASAQQVVDQANATLAASPQAGDAPRGALQGAAGALSAALAGPNVSVAALRTVTAGVAAPQQAVVDAQAAWVAAEQARIAAEQAAAAEAARRAAARAASTPQTVRPRSSGTASSSTPTGAAAAAPSGVPAGGKVCAGSGGGASEASAGAIGDAINAYRSANGLGTLSVSRSGGLTSHALDMASRGGIWHSGSDNIVGCVSNGSASSLVSAWSRSSGHNSQMLRTDVSAMSVGAGSSAGWLFGAVRFS